MFIGIHTNQDAVTYLGRLIRGDGDECLLDPGEIHRGRHTQGPSERATAYGQPVAAPGGVQMTSAPRPPPVRVREDRPRHRRISYEPNELGGIRSLPTPDTRARVHQCAFVIGMYDERGPNAIGQYTCRPAGR